MPTVAWVAHMEMAGCCSLDGVLELKTKGIALAAHRMFVSSRTVSERLKCVLPSEIFLAVT